MSAKKNSSISGENAGRPESGSTRGSGAGAGRRRRLVLAVVLSLLSIAALVGFYIFETPSHSGDQSAPRVEARDPARESSIAEPARRDAEEPEPRPEKRSGLAFRAGDYLRFEFHAERTLEVALAEEVATVPGRSSSDVDLKLDGTLHLRVYGESETHFTVGLELSGAKETLRASETGNLTGGKELVAGMGGELIAKLERSGRFESLSFPESTTPMGRNCWRGLLAHWQFVLAEDDSLQEWQITEEDPTGKYVAFYAKKETDGLIEITKEKQAYESVTGRGKNEADFADSTAAGGKSAIVLDPLPLSIRGEEWMQLRPEGIPQTFASEAKFSFTRLEHVHQKELADAGRLERSGYLAPSRIAEAESVEEEVVAQVMTEEEIRTYLTELQGEVVKIGLHAHQIAGYLARLVELIKQDPRVVAEVMARLRASDLDDDVAALFLSALGTAGTPPAQEGLREIFMGDAQPEGRRMSAMLAFADVESPGPEVDADLLRLHEAKSELSSTALLLLAAVADRVRNTEESRYAEIDALVRDQLADESLTRAERTTALEALGNLAPASTSPLVEEAVQSEDEHVRIAAVHALRRTLDKTAESIVTDALVDPSDQVRIAAVEDLLQNERGTAGDLLYESLRGDPSEQVRRKVLEGLGQRDAPEAREAIAWTAENDASEEVRRAAEEILQGKQENEQRMAEPQVVGETESESGE